VLDRNPHWPNVNLVNLDKARFTSAIEPVAHAAPMVNATPVRAKGLFIPPKTGAG
jgi:hypothetical protein